MERLILGFNDAEADERRLRSRHRLSEVTQVEVLMRAAIVMATGLVALTASLAVSADQKKYDEKFCAASASYQSDVAELHAIGPHSTVAEVRAAVDRLDTDVTQMMKAAAKMKTPTAKQFTDATKKLDKDVKDIPDDATLQQVHAKLQADVQSAETAGRQLAAEAGCPAAPEGRPQRQRP